MSKKMERIGFLVKTYTGLNESLKEVHTKIVDPIEDEKRAVMAEIKRIRDMPDEVFENEEISQQVH